jgi:hypothetical protein
MIETKTALTILVLSIFAVLGMWLFYNVNLHQDDGEFMDENVNYANFDTAFFSLFRQVVDQIMCILKLSWNDNICRLCTLFWAECIRSLDLADNRGSMERNNVLLL